MQYPFKAMEARIVFLYLTAHNWQKEKVDSVNVPAIKFIG